MPCSPSCDKGLTGSGDVPESHSCPPVPLASLVFGSTTWDTFELFTSVALLSAGFFLTFLQNSQTQVKVSSLNTQGLLPREATAAAFITGLCTCGAVCVSVRVWCVGVLYMHSCGSMDSCAYKSQMTHAPCSATHSPSYSPETGSVSR